MILPTTYLIWVDYGKKIGEAVLETYPGCVTLGQIVEDICSEQLDPEAILGIYEASEGEIINVTDEVQEGVIEEIRRGRMVSPFARQFAGMELELEDAA